MLLPFILLILSIFFSLLLATLNILLARAQKSCMMHSPR
jgi:hypothetical protein